MDGLADQKQRVLVVGCGGLGGIVTASLLEHGRASQEGHVDVVAFSRNRAVARAVAERGFVLRGVEGARAVEGRVVDALGPDTAPFDWIILAVQPTQVEEAARSVVSHLAEGGAMVCLQNGLCEERVAQIAGPERVLGAVVAWGGSMVEPGVYDRTAAGGFTVGRIDGKDDERLAKLALLLEPIGPVTVTSNLAGARWSKLAINCAISTLGTLGGKALGPLMLHRFVRRLALEVVTEAVEVARAEKIRLEKVSGTLDIDWIALTDAERHMSGSPGLVAKHGMLLAVGARYRRMRSSMLAAIERGQEPPVDFLNGEITRRGRKHGISTPFNHEACNMVHAIAAGTMKSGLSTLEELARRAPRSVLELGG
ncbi:ketopantoate reductase family protein [Pendulispora albinea]|uniref:2-dehydropantoate 2-reductase n=1 Tax=Pendulispora albinea TaxID=2741071 RepID=A0ABZ2M0A3_9BACT